MEIRSSQRSHQSSSLITVTVLKRKAKCPQFIRPQFFWGLWHFYVHIASRNLDGGVRKVHFQGDFWGLVCIAGILFCALSAGKPSMPIKFFIFLGGGISGFLLETGGLQSRTFLTKTSILPAFGVIYSNFFPRSWQIGHGWFWRESSYPPRLGYFAGGPPKKNRFYVTPPPPANSIKKKPVFLQNWALTPKKPLGK